MGYSSFSFQNLKVYLAIFIGMAGLTLTYVPSSFAGKPSSLSEALKETVLKYTSEYPKNHYMSEFLSWVIETGDFKANNHMGGTLLHFAATWGDIKFAKLLIQYGLDINAQDDNGETPLYTATRTDHKEIVGLLLAHGANKEIKTLSGETALPYLLQQQCHEIAQILGADLSRDYLVEPFYSDIEAEEEMIHKDSQSSQEEKSCVICCEQKPEIVFNCGHLYTCEKCSNFEKLKHCPICRAEISTRIKVFQQ